uniref:Uncharacterized protein n=1 Tax=Cacopsylla melanoneura TaxID=428564 RepID=A0A8D8TAJ9_9HEMI
MICPSRYSRDNSNMEDVTEESNQSIHKYSRPEKNNYGRDCNRSKSNIRHEEVEDKPEKIKRKSKRQQDPRESIDGIVSYNTDDNHQDKDKGKQRDAHGQNSNHSIECRNEHSLGDKQQSRGSFGDNRHVRKETINKRNVSRKTEGNRTRRPEKSSPSENCTAPRIEGTRRKVSKKSAKGKANESESTKVPTGPVKKSRTKSKTPLKENGSEIKTNPDSKKSKTKKNLDNNMDAMENDSITNLAMVLMNDQITTRQLTTDSYETNTTNCSEKTRIENIGHERNNNKTRNQRYENQGKENIDRTNGVDEAPSMSKNENPGKVMNGRTNRIIEASRIRRKDKGNQNQNLQQESKDSCQESKDPSQEPKDYCQGSKDYCQGSTGRMAGNRGGNQQGR